MELSLHQETLLVLLLAVAQPLVLAQSPCGEPNLEVSIPEYPYINYNDRPFIPLAELPSCRALLIQTTRWDLELTVRYDPNYQGDIPPESVRLDYLIPFGTNPAGWYLQMTVGINRDGIASPDVLTFQLECVDPNVPNVKNYHMLTIKLEDSNDTQPTFQNLPFTLDASELTPVGVTVLSVNSTTLDADKSNNRIVQHKIDTATDSLTTDIHYITNSKSPKASVVQDTPIRRSSPVPGSPRKPADKDKRERLPRPSSQGHSDSFPQTSPPSRSTSETPKRSAHRKEREQ